jgi:cytochrome c oxidase subunit 2
MARKPVVFAAFACLALLLASGAAAGNGGVAPPDSATASGSRINALYWIIFAMCAVIFVLVEGALLYFIFRFRRGRGVPADADGPQIHGNARLEILWTIVPVFILIGIAVGTFVSVGTVNANPSKDENALTVKVEAHQFYWQYVYPNGAVSLDTLRVPVDRTVSLELTAPDVAHSWWVPELTGKRDAIPGRVNVLDFKARRTGSFAGQCAEFCGVQHAVMRTTVEVMEPAAFESWLAGEAAAQTEGTSSLGKDTFETVCAKCHGMRGEGDVGPSLVGKVTDRKGLEPLLLVGQDTSLDGYMPAVGVGWPDHQVDALVEYMTLSPDLSGGAG